MKRFTPCLAALLLLADCQTSASTVPVREAYYVVGVDVNAQGHITKTQPSKDVNAGIAKFLSMAMRLWQFKPATLNGRPVPAHTYVHVKLRATPDAHGHYALRLSFMSNGPYLDRNAWQQPRYPKDCIWRHKGALVFLDATVRPDGTLASGVVTPQVRNEHIDPSFKKAVLDAARHWHAEPESVNGQLVATRLRVPVNFTLDGDPDGGLTRADIELLRKEARPDAATRTIPLPVDDPIALDSPLSPTHVTDVAVAP